MVDRSSRIKLLLKDNEVLIIDFKTGVKKDDHLKRFKNILTFIV